MLSIFILLPVLGVLSQPPAPIDCSAVSCLRPLCPNGELVVPPNRCCPVCVPKPDCSAVLCAKPSCSNPITPPGECCPQCPDCSAVSCVLPTCDKPVVPPGECCPQCPIDCSKVFCKAVACPGAITPPGACCPQCPIPDPVDCRLVLCARPLCPNPITLPGQCCPTCPEDCSSQTVRGRCGLVKDRTCKNPNPEQSSSEECTKGCYCNPGFVRKNRKCVPLEMCLKCPKNFKFMGCATCNATCTNPNPICTAECKPASCVCRPPYAINHKGKCVLAKRCKKKPNSGGNCCKISPEECPLIDCPPEYLTGYPGACCETICTQCTKPNTEFLYQGLTDFRRCGRPNPPVRPNAPKPGCYCKKGFVRNERGNCVPQSTCPDFCASGCKSFFDGCNGCTCRGNLALCTKIACEKYDAPRCTQCCDPLAKFFEAGPCVSPCGSAPCRNFQAGPPGCYCSDPENMRLNENGKCVPKELCDGCETKVCPRLDLACPSKADQIFARPSDCCPVCKSCLRVNCARSPTTCPSGAVPFVPSGECCPRCPDCSTVKCASCESQCGRGAKCAYRTGECCPRCCDQVPDCPGLRCATQLCPDGETPFGCMSKCFLSKDLECKGRTPKSVCSSTC